MRRLLLLLIPVFVLGFVAYAQAESPKLIFKNKCADIDPANPDWTCLNKTQAAQSVEATEQVLLAIKNTKFKKPITIILRDPKILHSAEYGRYWQFGAWLVNGKIEFAAMPGCPNGRKLLERLLRQIS